MRSRPDLRLDWCSHEAANFAVKHWHYSRSMPAGKVVKVGVWEGGTFVGCVLFGRGSNKHIGVPFGLGQTEAVELVRVALTTHAAPVSRIIAISCRLLKCQSPGLRVVLSFADANQGHVGTIYQAAGWTYTGYGSLDSRCRPYVAPNGHTQHWRAVNGTLRKLGKPATVEAAESIGFKAMTQHPKHRYLFPLDSEMRAKCASLAKPYPKRERSRENAATPPSVEGGVIPTRSLHAVRTE